MSTTTTTPNQAARLNDEGASYIERGDDSSAFAAFKDALESLSSDAVAQTTASVSAMLTPPTVNVGNGNSTRASTTRPVANCPRTDAPAPADDEEAYQYDRCLSFEQGHTSDPDALPYCSAVIIFNMALVFQKRGTDEKTLYKALFLYMVSLRHIQSCTSDSFKKTDVVIAALNNQAVVFYLLKDYAKARTVLGELWNLLRELRCRPRSFMKSDIDGIVQNILLLLHSPSLAAAA
ncbi:expressed unknown protein [Seminavis robusta]|uniref:Uncharacterized protein n=1 Tax=Seminavis robusta TaxID=568900 RepID=A0A9N8EB02_9STRA|nr:expressed unknown protein [Seminavis robusta]|eukprot:Sro905_g218550.1 n/a (235) ;mRNA; r:25622-26326